MCGRVAVLLVRKSRALPEMLYAAELLLKVSVLRIKGLEMFWISAVPPAPLAPKSRTVSMVLVGSVGFDDQLEATAHRPLELPVQVCARAGGVQQILKIAA